MAKVVFEHISKSFDQTQIIQDLSLAVRDEEFLVLVGPSGCGKSTLLRILAGLEPQTAGNLYIGEHLVNTVAPKDRDIAMVFQNYALYPHMSVYDNMAFGLKMRKFPKAAITERVHEAAKSLDLSHLLTRKPKQLSGGQRQRVALGRAIVRNPQVFLMDEPLSNLDAKLRVQMRAEISRLHQRLKTTTIYVTHDQVEAMTMGERIVILNQGRIQQVDQPMTIYNKPCNRFVAGFIGQMNFISGTLNGLLLELPEGLSVDLTALPILSSTEGARPYQGKALTLGIRPEHILIHPVSGTLAHQSPTMSLTVEHVELLGDEKIIHGTLPAANTVRLLVKCPPAIETPLGSTLPIAFDLAAAHLFDGENGHRLN